MAESTPVLARVISGMAVAVCRGAGFGTWMAGRYAAMGGATADATRQGAGRIRVIACMD